MRCRRTLSTAMLPNRSIPPGTVIPELAYPDVVTASAWLCTAFGFTERLRIGDHRVQLVFAGGAVVVTDGGGPEPREPTHGVLVRVDDVDRHHERAKRAGARILREPADHPFGERQYTALDVGGHRWTFSQTIADVDPATWGGVVPGR
jgi:uncharacterized glyoxalase superfamily protein PhnB